MTKRFYILTLLSLVTFYSSNLIAQLTPPTDFSTLPAQSFFNDVQFVPTSSTMSCNSTSFNVSPDFVGKYRTLDFWKPTTNTPIKTVQIAIHVFTGNNSLTASDIPWINAVIGAMNYDLSNICPPSDPLIGVTHIYDSKIRVELSNRIYFYNGSPYYNSNNAGGMINYINSVDPSRLDYLPILVPITGSGIQNATLPWPGYSPLSASVTSLNSNLFAYCPTDNQQSWAWLKVVEHELGHCFDLQHLYDSDVCDPASSEYLHDIFGPVYNPNCYLQGGWSCDPFLSTNTCTNNWMGAWHSACYLSPLQMGKIHRALSLKTTRRYVKDEYITALPYDIATNEMWNFDIRWYGDIHVKANTTWTIKCKIMMSVGSKIVVERGGKIIVDGGMISSAGGIWKGIEVWGNSTQPQGNVTSNGQGTVLIINGGTIENAEIGVAATQYGASGLPDPNYGGGIIRAENATFRTNVTAAQIITYPAIPLSNSVANFSYFKNCTFETDGNWVDNNVYPQNFLDLREVTGFVTMLGCTFRNSAPGNFPVGNRGTGIFGVDAMFRVGAYCPTLTCTNPILNTFENLTYGVNVASSIGFLTCNVDRATFTNCDKGVSLRGIDWASTTRCNFTVSPGTLNDPHFGIYLDDCDGFSVQENKVTGTGAPSYNVGIVIKDSRDRSNIVYNNTLDNLHVGLEALGDNDGQSPEDGLRFNCNDMTNNLYDIFVTNATNQNLITTDIGRIQGEIDPSNPNPKQLVRNTYSAVCVGNNENQFRVTKSSINPIIHEHHTDAFTLPQCRDGLVYTTQRNYNFNKAQDCPSFLATPANHSTLRTQLVTYADEITEQQALLDAGNSPNLLNTIASASPGTVRNELLAVGPYLSDDVLIAAINSGLPPGILKEILIPNSPLNVSVMQALEQQTIPNGIDGELEAAQTGISEREKVEVHIQQLKFERDLILSERIRLLLNDSDVVNPFDSVTAIIKYEQIPDQKCRLASAYIAKGDYARADSTLDVIEAEQQPGLDNFCQLLRILIELHQSVVGCLALHSDTVKTAEVTAIAAEPNDKGCMQAQALLMKVFMYFYPEDVVFPENEISLREMHGAISSNSNQDFRAYPNPASDWLDVEYKISSPNSTAQLIVIDVTGKEVIRQKISPAEKNARVDISMLCTGLYFWRVVSDAEVLYTDKFSVIK